MRVKGLSVVRHNKHKKILKKAQSYRGRRSTCYRMARDAVRQAGANNFVGRKKRTRNYRTKSIRIMNNFFRLYGSKYSKEIKNINKHGLSRHSVAKCIIHSAFGDSDQMNQLDAIKNMLFSNK